MKRKTLKEREKDIIRKERYWAKEKPICERELQLRNEKLSFFSKNKKPMPTSKKLIFFLFINCTLIELFVLWVTVKSIALSSQLMMSPDFSPLVTLVGAVVGEVIGYAVYSAKAAKENTQGGIVYDSAMKDNLSEQDGLG